MSNCTIHCLPNYVYNMYAVHCLPNYVYNMYAVHYLPNYVYNMYAVHCLSNYVKSVSNKLSSESCLAWIQYNVYLIMSIVSPSMNILLYLCAISS